MFFFPWSAGLLCTHWPCIFWLSSRPKRYIKFHCSNNYCNCCFWKRMSFQTSYCHCALFIHVGWINPIAGWLQCYHSRDLAQLFLITLIHYASSTLMLRFKQSLTSNIVKSARRKLIHTSNLDSFHRNYLIYNRLFFSLKRFNHNHNLCNNSQSISFVITLLTQRFAPLYLFSSYFFLAQKKFLNWRMYCQLNVCKKSICSNQESFNLKISLKSPGIRVKLSKHEQKLWNFYTEPTLWSSFEFKERIWWPNFWRFQYENEILWNFHIFKIQRVKWFTFFHTCWKNFSNFFGNGCAVNKESTVNNTEHKLPTKNFEKNSFTTNEWRVWTAHFATLT